LKTETSSAAQGRAACAGELRGKIPCESIENLPGTHMILIVGMKFNGSTAFERSKHSESENPNRLQSSRTSAGKLQGQTYEREEDISRE
jgi:hypothetical protein